MPTAPWLLRAASIAPARTALAAPGQLDLSYAELADRAMMAAGGLAERGVVAGQRVALALDAGADFVTAFHGCLLLGAIAVPIDSRLHPDEQAVRSGGALVVDKPLTGHHAAAPTPMRLEATATLMHTSGTTAAPKAVPLNYGNWLASALGSAVALGLDPGERWLCPMPLAHVGGLSIVMRSAIYATTAVIEPRFDAPRVVAALRDETQRITLVSLVPTMLARLLDAGLKRPPTLRWALLGGGPITPGLLELARVAGVPVAPTYGMTEACSQIATNGWALPGVEIELAPDGEILVRGATVSPAAVSPDGWLHTGDLGTLDAEGRLAVTGRTADTIVTGGENVAPAEVEAVLLEHHAVDDAAVFARPDAEWGEAVVATVVTRDGLSVTAEDLRAHCAARLARFKVPKEFTFASGLPRTESGKLLRRQLG